MSPSAMKRYPLILIWFGLWIVAPLALIRMAWAIFTNPERAWLIALSFDDLGNVATNGMLGESISSRAAQQQIAAAQTAAAVVEKAADEPEPEPVV